MLLNIALSESRFQGSSKEGAIYAELMIFDEKQTTMIACRDVTTQDDLQPTHKPTLWRHMAAYLLPQAPVTRLDCLCNHNKPLLLRHCNCDWVSIRRS